MIDGSLQQVGVETQHVPSGRQELCPGHQLQKNGLHVLEEREGERGGEADETKRKEKGGERKEKIILNVYVFNLLHSLIGTVLCTAHNTTGYSWTSLSFCVINWTN